MGSLVDRMHINDVNGFICLVDDVLTGQNDEGKQIRFLDKIRWLARV